VFKNGRCGELMSAPWDWITESYMEADTIFAVCSKKVKIEGFISLCFLLAVSQVTMYSQFIA
jgi:hypothetical protein